MSRTNWFAGIALAACFCWLTCPRLATAAPGGQSKDRSHQAGSDIQPQYKQPIPAVIPSFADPADGVTPRGTPPPCVFQVCDQTIYLNGGGTSGSTFGDQNGVPLYDDINFTGVERFICRISVVVGGINNSGGVVPMTLTVRTGNLTPDCPDSPNSQVIFTAVQDLQLTNPFQIVEYNFDPAILVDENFVWIGLSTPPPGNDASWAIADVAETGTTADLFVIPNGDNQCTFGAGGDYFFFGGDPLAGMGMLVEANDGPPGACCLRDTDIGGGASQCNDGVLRSACLTNTVNVWKPGECADFGTDPACSPCITNAQACAGASLEGEPVCGPGYEDFFNQGCLEAPFSFSAIACGQVVCGESGNYNAACTDDSECADGQTCQSGVCSGPTDSRDNDWYRFVLTQDTQVTATLIARFPAQISIMNNGGAPQSVICPTAANAFLEFDRGRACDTLTVTRCLPPGEWILRVRPDTFEGIPCSTKYRLSLTCSPCDLPEGACCDTSPSGCSSLAEIACTGRGGVYQGDGTNCAGAGCPGLPANDTCANKITLTGVSVSATYDSTFATTDDLATHPGQDVPADCEIGELAAPNVPIVADVFYNYRIPTNFNGTAITQGEVIISTAGSAYDTWVVVYGDPSLANTCGASACSRPQTACNDDILADDNIGAKFNSLSYLSIPVVAGSIEFFDPGDCLKIRVGGAGAPPAGRGEGQINIDFIPRSAPFALQTGRCCFENGTCNIQISDADCINLGGYPRTRVDFNQGDPAIVEQSAGCLTDPCPGPGQACYTALDFNTLVGSSGTLTRDVNHVLFVKYELPASGGVVIDTCGSQGDTILGIYSSITTNPGAGELYGDCALNSLVLLNDNCTVTSSSADGALQTSTCYGGLNATFDSCLCLQVGSSPALQPGNVVYIAIGGTGQAGGPIFGNSPRDIFDPVLNNLAGTLAYQLNITTVSQCFVCPSSCPGGSLQEGPDQVCADTNDPNPQDLYNGGCNPSVPSFNGPSIDCSGGPVVICGRAGNYSHPFPCDTPLDCPNSAPCSGPGGFCIGATPFIDRDEDWYLMTVDQPSTIRWRVLSAEFAAELAIFSDPERDCDGLFVFAAGSQDFACEPPTGTPTSLEVTATVCAGTYYLVVRPSVFGGLGEANCSSDYVVEASCQPFEQVTTCCPGDMNTDGKVNGLDIQKWISVLFTPPTVADEFLGCFAPNYCRADINVDGVITLADLPSFVNLLVTATKPVCETPPACSDPSTSQQPFDSMGVTLSDLDATDDARAADCFKPTESGNITTVCWWGTYLNSQGLTCSAEKDCFQITFYSTELGCTNSAANRCPNLRIEPPGSQYIANVSRVASGGIITPAGVVTEFFYTATLPVPMPVVAGQCYWIEIVNNTPENDCRWHWEQSPQGDTRHAFVDVSPATGDLPTDYSACNKLERDLAFSTNIRIAKDGCGKPNGNCCYDAPPLGVVDCVVTTEENCVFTLFGSWTEDGTCPGTCPPLGRCCYLDQFNATQCVSTYQTTCNSLGGLWTSGASCPCPTGRCCVGTSCTPGLTEVECLSQGGAWLGGATCAQPCPTGICNNNARCQLPHLSSGLQQGGYVTDIDNAVKVADDFRPV
ncbi:MAG: hypothetical protein DCC65_16020, partial [Planctomycetota bacterium]